MKEDKNEARWDKLLRIRTMGRDDSGADQYRYPYEQLHIVCWSVWRIADGFERGIRFWIMAAGKGVWIFSYPIRRDVSPSESNRMNGFTSGQCRIKKQQILLVRFLLNLQMQRILSCRNKKKL